MLRPSLDIIWSNRANTTVDWKLKMKKYYHINVLFVLSFSQVEESQIVPGGNDLIMLHATKFRTMCIKYCEFQKENATKKLPLIRLRKRYGFDSFTHHLFLM